MSNAHKRFDLSSLTRITYGTEPINVHLLERINKVFPNAILQQTYGLSEVGVLASRSESNESTRLELGGSGFDTKVVDGILWIKSEFAMLGYLSTEGANDFVDGWFNTKDQVIQDGKYFKFVGRDSDQINVGGQKVLPIEVEEEIMLLNEVLDVQVFGEKHLLLGQIVVANVVLASDVESEGVKLKIRKHCQERLTKYKVPQKIFFVSQIEVSSRGKRVKGVSSEAGKE
jgi:acyl-coenzyme A synthetase/AMP-(fatty) acid ligase